MELLEELKTATYDEDLSIKAREYGKYRDSERQIVEVSGFVVKYCWDIEYTEEKLTFKTLSVFRPTAPGDDLKVSILNLMPAAAASFTIVEVTKPKNFKTYKQY